MAVYTYTCIRKMLSNTAILYTSIFAVADSSSNMIPSNEEIWVNSKLEMMRYKQKYRHNLRYCPEMSLERLRKLENISAVRLASPQAQIWSWPSTILRRDAKHQKTNLDLDNTLHIICGCTAVISWFDFQRRNFSLRQRVQTGSEAHAASFSKGTTAYIAGTKRSKCVTHHSPPSRAKGKTRRTINSIPYMFARRRT
jgi:hypothetical protein